MNDLLDLLGRQLGDDRVERLSREIGADPSATSKAVEVALPLLVGGLARNAASPQGAASLSRALDRDHTPDLLDNLGSLLGGAGGGDTGGAGGLLGSLLGGGSRSSGGVGSLLGSILGGGGPKALDGAGILGHIFGSRRPGVEQGMERASGLGSAQIGKLLTLLAPIVMSALAKAKQSRSLDEGGLSGYLGEQRREIETRTPGMGSGGLLGMLDRDDDGSIADDIASIGVSLGGSLLGGRR